MKSVVPDSLPCYQIYIKTNIYLLIYPFFLTSDPHSQTIILLTKVVHTLWFSLLRKNITGQEGQINENSLDLPLPFIQEMQVLLLNLLQNYR